MGGERTYRPPSTVRSACAAALSTVEKYKRRGVEAASLLARRIARGDVLKLGELEQLYAWLADADAHNGAQLANKLDDGGPTTVGIAFELSGGRATLDWARTTLTSEGRLHPPRDGEPASWTGQILKVDDGLGVVFGWAIVSAIEGEPYFDTQGDHIPESAMLNAAVDFMANSRQLGDMHKADEGGTVLFAFPMTAEIAKAFGLETTTTGLMIGVKPLRKATLEKFKSGEYSGFSIGGRRKVDEEVAA